MGDTFDVTTIIFAALALFVSGKLRSVLGTRTGNEPRPDPMARNAGQDPGPGRERMTKAMSYACRGLRPTAVVRARQRPRRATKTAGMASRKKVPRSGKGSIRLSRPIRPSIRVFSSTAPRPHTR